MVGWLVPLLALTVAQGPAGEAGPAGVPPVTVPVQVLDDRGRPVTMLAPPDFRVTDGGVAVRVVDARYVPPAPASAPGLGPEADGRVLAFFLDEYHVAAGDSARVRDALTGFIRRHVTPQDWVLVVKPLDPLLTLTPVRGAAAALEAVASFHGRLGDYEPRTAFERDLIAADPVRVDRARARIAFSAVQAIVTRLAPLGLARKAFVIVSEGWEPARAGVRSGVLSGETLAGLDAIVRVATRSNVAVSMLDPRADVDRPAPAEPTSPSANPLAELVRHTDGRAIRAPFDADLDTVAGDLGGYYLLTLAGAGDGQFHPLDVSLGRAGTRVHVRPGYWALAADEIARLAPAPTGGRDPAPQIPLRTSRLIVPWFGQERLDAARTRVTFVWDPSPTRAGERSRVLPPSRVVLTARTREGAIIYEGIVQSVSSGFHPLATASFTAPPGRLRVQMSIEDASARVLDTDVRDIVVGAFAGAAAFGTPRVFRARTAREFNELVADADAPPVPARSFTRGERLLFRLPYYAAPGSAPGVVTAVLVNRSGQVMRRLAAARSAQGAFVSTDLLLSSLAAGEYGVQWRATGDTVDLREAVSFRVTP